jgi:hypothetical protein
MTYNYVVVITGQIEAPNEEHARVQALMGVSLTGRLLASPHEVGVKVGAVEEKSDGQKPTPIGH